MGDPSRNRSDQGGSTTDSAQGRSVRRPHGELRELAADRRDRIAEDRSANAGQRDAVADRRDAVADKRDAEGAHRDDDGAQRDAVADELTTAASRRDRVAEERDRAADRRDRDAAVTNCGSGAAEAARDTATRIRAEAASDRQLVRDDRNAGAADRKAAASDRVTALADRMVTAHGRERSDLDRDRALVDRIAGASERRLSGLDRDRAVHDRVASAGDRRSAAALELRMVESDARAWRLLQAIPDPVVVVDRDGIIELINVQAVVLFGYQPAELIGQPVERLIPSELHAAHRQLRNSYTTGEAPQPMSTGPNVSERKLSEAELRISDERFRGAFGLAPIGMALIDLHPPAVGRFLRVNRGVVQIDRLLRGRMLATSSLAITHPDDEAATAANLDRLASGALPRWDTDRRYRNASGDDGWVHFVISVVHDADGLPSYGVSQVADITDRKKAEEQLAERFHELATNVDVGFLVRQVDPPEFLYFNPAYLRVFGIDPAGPPPSPEQVRSW